MEGNTIFRCPECEETNSLFIEHMVSCITQVGKYTDVEDYEIGDVTWEDDDDARCSDCGWQGRVREMIGVEEEEVVDETNEAD